MLDPLTHGCPDVVNATLLENQRFFDAAVCPGADVLTLPIFGAMVLVGVVNIPIYIQTRSALIPFVLTLVIGGVAYTAAAGIMQAISVTVVLFVIGIGPILVLRQVQQP